MGKSRNVEDIHKIYEDDFFDFFWNMETGKIIPYRLIKESLENYKGNH